MKPWRLCNHSGCRKLTRERYCQDHRYVPPTRKRDKFLDTQAWRDLRAAFVEAHPYCQHCYPEQLVAAEDVDHILPRRTHPELALDWNNLQSLCKTCHLDKTRKGL